MEPRDLERWQDARADLAGGTEPRLSGTALRPACSSHRVEVWTDEARVYPIGVLYDKRYYITTTKGGYDRLGKNIGKEVPFGIIPLGGEDKLAMACLDGKTYEKVVDRAEQEISRGEHKEQQRTMVRN